VDDVLSIGHVREIDDNRVLSPWVFAYPAHSFVTIQLTGHHDIHENRVWVVGECFFNAFRTVCCGDDNEADARKGVSVKCSYVFVVFNDEYRRSHALFVIANEMLLYLLDDVFETRLRLNDVVIAFEFRTL
jgi:hypothetical protein